MEHVTPVSALIGGALIGLSATLLWLANGRIAGISGILGSLSSPSGEAGWRLAFLVGLIAAPLLYTLFTGHAPQISMPQSPPLLIGAGLLVGFGTRLGSGCTSGHGVCGLARLSPRAIAATLTFMATAFATVYLTHHML